MTNTKWTNPALRKAIASAGATGAALWLVLSPAQATDNQIVLQSCTADLCAGLNIRGVINDFQVGAKNYAGEWAEKFLAPANVCLRIQVTQAEGNDVEMNVISPSGVNYREDDNAGGLLPRVEVPSTESGYYTAIVHHFGSGALKTNVDVFWSEFNAGNPNCANPSVAK